MGAETTHSALRRHRHYISFKSRKYHPAVCTQHSRRETSTRGVDTTISTKDDAHGADEVSVISPTTSNRGYIKHTRCYFRPTAVQPRPSAIPVLQPTLRTGTERMPCDLEVTQCPQRGGRGSGLGYKSAEVPCGDSYVEVKFTPRKSSLRLVEVASTTLATSWS